MIEELYNSISIQKFNWRKEEHLGMYSNYTLMQYQQEIHEKDDTENTELAINQYPRLQNFYNTSELGKLFSEWNKKLHV